ncbi:DUF561 domain-containing protein [Prochlorococcus sp. MIT 1307]|uniref:DUF561 domain-containing protein n=1 Tax=Prochlorococcus sp. MIT 1307 TaxID=3096219 RepID=UPI002A757644|nr:DUF561 domain-containing protein [Prochlorococcus sp. MIT 1307]
MARLHHLPPALQQSLEQRSLLKVIAGLSNFDPVSVEMVARAAGGGGADLLDVACEPDLVHLAIHASGLPVCVSAVEPDLFPKAIEAGAAMIEIGNFDSFYSRGRFFSAQEVFQLTIQTRKLLPNVVLSVTVPHVLPLHEQAQLALDLSNAGADLIQTEGGTSSRPLSAGNLGMIEKAAPTLAATQTIFDSLKQAGNDIPLLCASGLSAVTVPMALAVGASGVGIGSAVNRLSNELEMIAVVKRLREATSSFSSSLAVSQKCS